MWGLSSAMTGSSHNSSHLPQKEINPSKTACGPFGKVIIKNKNKIKKETVTYIILSSWRMHLSKYNCVIKPGDPQSVPPVENSTTTTPG